MGCCRRCCMRRTTLLRRRFAPHRPTARKGARISAGDPWGPWIGRRKASAHICCLVVVDISRRESHLAIVDVHTATLHKGWALAFLQAIHGGGDPWGLIQIRTVSWIKRRKASTHRLRKKSKRLRRRTTHARARSVPWGNPAIRKKEEESKLHGVIQP